MGVNFYRRFGAILLTKLKKHLPTTIMEILHDHLPLEGGEGALWTSLYAASYALKISLCTAIHSQCDRVMRGL